MSIAINLAVAALMFGIVYWFWLTAPAPVVAGRRVIDVLVENGSYDPALIEAKMGETLHLRFIRHDATPCAAMVLFDDLGISRELPMDEPVEIGIDCERPGEFEFTCQVGMCRGRLIVRR